jgi:hypothetical protein
VGSVRNPVGPLPSSIYWRRRAVGLSLLALAVVIVILVLNSGGGGGGNGSSGPSSSHTPVATITAGPAPSGTHISSQPGGRDTAPSDTGTSTGGTGDGSSGDTSGSAGTSGTTAGDDTSAGTSSGTSTGTTSGSSSGDTSAGTSGSTGGSSTTGGELAVGSTLPDCDPGPVTLSLTSVQNSYSPGETPSFQLRATNSGDITCKVDFGPTKAVFTVTKAADTSHVWASDDCPTTGSYLMQVPAHGSTTYTLRWNEKTSSPKCASPKGQQAAAGTYLVQAQMSGYGTKQVSFVLSAD